MEDIITINGIEYIRKDCIQEKDYDVLMKNLNNILDNAHKEISSLIDSYDSENGITPKSSRLVEGGVTTSPKPKRKRRKYRRGSDVFEPNDFAKKEYKILGVNDDWTFRILGSTKSGFSIKQIIKVRNKILNNTISMDEAKQIAKECDFSYSVFMKVFYNIKIGTFDKYIKDYIQTLEANKPLKKKKVTIQNNPQKRKEMGLS